MQIGEQTARGVDLDVNTDLGGRNIPDLQLRLRATALR